MFSKKIKSKYSEEELEWIRLSPERRFIESSKLWQIYLSLGGSLDPKPDPQSPFNFLYYPQRRHKSTSFKRKRLRRKEKND